MVNQWMIGGIALSGPGVMGAAVVGTIDDGGAIDISIESGRFSSAEMQALITATDDLEVAGVLDAEGEFTPGDFSRDDVSLAFVESIAPARPVVEIVRNNDSNFSLSFSGVLQQSRHSSSRQSPNLFFTGPVPRTNFWLLPAVPMT